VELPVIFADLSNTGNSQKEIMVGLSGNQIKVTLIESYT
jgi:hypothetical protein